MASTQTVRRPRIDSDVAAYIDDLREDLPFESYVNDVLRNHVERRNARSELDDEDRQEPVVALYDRQDVGIYLNALDGGWGNDNFEGVTAGLSIDDETYGHVGGYLTDNDLRALRDAITDLLGEIKR